MTTGGMAELYARVQQFYVHQMRLSEEGAFDDWADTFAGDAVFEDSLTPEPLRGREAIRAAVRQGVERIVADDLDFRHWFSGFEVEPGPDGSVRTRYYALAMATPRGGEPALRGHADCEDHLVPHGESWLVRRRVLRFDG